MSENTEKNLLESPKPFFSLGTLDKYIEGDRQVWLLVVLLSLISLLVVYSATGTIAFKMQRDSLYYLSRHFFNIFLGLSAVWVAHKLDYRYYAKLSRLALLISVPLLLFVWLFGSTVNEASRWLEIPIFGKNLSFQPSDLAKLALIASIASMLSKRQDNVDDFQETIVPILVWTGLICMLIGLTNVSNAILLFITALILMFIGRIPINQLLLFVLTGIVSIMLALAVGQRYETALGRLDRFTGVNADHFQEEQACIAIANGGLIGKGPGNSSQRNFLPNSFSDFIYAIIIEEYGLLGALITLGLYLMLLYRGMVIMANTSHPFGGILAAGLSISLVLQALLNMAVSVRLVPVTGLPLPMLSMGGTSIVFTGLALGIIISISKSDKQAINNDEAPQELENRERSVV